MSNVMSDVMSKGAGSMQWNSRDVKFFRFVGSHTLDITFLYQILLSKFPHRHHNEKCDVDVMSDVMSKGTGSMSPHPFWQIMCYNSTRSILGAVATL